MKCGINRMQAEILIGGGSIVFQGMCICADEELKKALRLIDTISMFKNFDIVLDTDTKALKIEDKTKTPIVVDWEKETV